MIDPALYAGREQTLVKHFVLDAYLERFAHIIGFWATTVTYIDCFSGPWRSRSPDLRDTSFAIAIDQLRRARETHAAKGRHLRLRAFFIEASADSYARLKAFADDIHDVEIETRKAEFETALSDILKFVDAAGPDTVTFTFIDPTGWSGFAMDVITPLLRVTPGEVLINFMTDYVRRFVDAPEDATSSEFVRMFGADVRAKVRGLPPSEREDALVAEYVSNLAKRGRFTNVSSAIVFKPDVESTYFHLIYGTRHDKGLEVFKDVERKMQPVMANARANAKARKEEARSGQKALLPLLSGYPSTRQATLRARYLEMSRNDVFAMLQLRKIVEYDELWRTALARPLVWEADLKDWLEAWHSRGDVSIEGLAARERVPKRESKHAVRWLRD